MEDARFGAAAVGLVQDWPLVERETAADYRIFRAMRELRRSPRTGREHEFVVLDGPDWVNVVALTERRDFILVRQFRVGSRESTLEIPGGLVDAGELPLLAAQRELLEETGYAAESWSELGWVHPNPSVQSNRCFTFLALNCRKVGELQLDPGEDIQVELVAHDEFLKMAREGAIHHALVLAALFFYGGGNASGA